MGQLGSLALVIVLAGIGLQIFRSVPEGAFRRPLGQMIIATLVHLVLAAAGGIAVFMIWALGTARGEWAPISAGAAVLILGVLVPLYAWWRWSGERWKPIRARDLATLQAQRDLTLERLNVARTINEILTLELRRLEQGDTASSHGADNIVERMDDLERVQDALDDESEDVPITPEEIDRRREEIRRLSEEFRQQHGKP
jgi:hypothetical protein